MTKQFLEYAIPSAVAMCVASLNTIIDGIFLGNGVGDNALAAVGIVMPISIVFFGLATMIAVGGGALISKYFGAKEDEKAVSVFRQVTTILIVMSLSLSAICTVFANPIVKIMGATDAIQPLAVEYLVYYSIFCLPNLLGIAFSSFLRNDNKPKQAMVATICGTISNIILNYIFIFVLGLGIKSAAIATGLGQTVTLLIALPHFILKKGKLTFGKQKLEFETLVETLRVGFPSFFAEGAYSIIIFIHNIVIARTIGDIGIAAYAIVNYIVTNIYFILLGITLGAQPLISYNFGSKDSEKMLEVYRLSNKTSLIASIIFMVLCFVFGKEIIGVFTKDQQLIDITYVAVNITNLAYLFIGKNLTTIMYYQAINITKFSNIICAMRCIIALPIVLIIFSNIFGENGIWISMAVSELVTIFLINARFKVNQYTNKSMKEIIA